VIEARALHQIMVEIRALRDDEHGWAAERYREIRFAESPPGTRGFVAEIGGARVGLGRLVEHEPGLVELGGVWTAETARNQGVARAMVNALLGEAPQRPLWCIPFAHLAAFYESFGFEVARPPWPGAIEAKVKSVVAQHLPSVVVLVREPTRGTSPI
jgi:GNAT superfamily N-acetyltransferase